MKPHVTATWTFRLLSALVMICVVIGTSAIAVHLSAQANDEHRSPASVRNTSDDVLAAFQAGDGKRLALLVHPEKGVRFSPSAYVDLDNDIAMSRLQVEAFWADSNIYVWGYAEGTGDPIELTPAAYAERYILDRDYSNPLSVKINDDHTAGTTTVNNAADVYPLATRVQYFIDPGAGTLKEGEDWTALRLVFENAQDSQFLIAVIHDARSF